MQYLTSGGELHVHDENALSKTINVDEAKRQYIRRRLVAGGGPALRARLRAIVVNNTSTSSYATAMAPNDADVVDLTADDDHSASKKNAKVRPNQPAPANSTKAPAIKFIPDPKKPAAARPRLSASERAERAYFRPPSDAEQAQTRDSPVSLRRRPEDRTKTANSRPQVENQKVRGSLGTPGLHGPEVDKSERPKTNGVSSLFRGTKTTFATDSDDDHPIPSSAVPSRHKDKPAPSPAISTGRDKDRPGPTTDMTAQTGTKRSRESNQSENAVKKPRLDIRNGTARTSSTSSSPSHVDKPSSTPSARSVPPKSTLRQSITSQPIDLTRTPPKDLRIVNLLSDEEDEDPPPKEGHATSKKVTSQPAVKQASTTAAAAAKITTSNVTGDTSLDEPPVRREAPTTPSGNRRQQTTIAETPTSGKESPYRRPHGAAATAASSSPRKGLPAAKTPPKNRLQEKRIDVRPSLDENSADGLSTEIGESPGDQLRKEASAARARDEHLTKPASAQATQQPVKLTFLDRETMPEQAAPSPARGIPSAVRISQGKESVENSTSKFNDDQQKVPRPKMTASDKVSSPEQHGGLEAADSETQPTNTEQAVTDSFGKNGTGPASSLEPESAAASSAQVSLPAEKSASAIAALGLSKQVEHVLGKYLEELRGDNEYWNKVSLKRARASIEKHNKRANGASPDSALDAGPPYSFANMKPVACFIVEKGTSIGNAVNFQVEKMARPGIKSSKSTMACPVTPMETHDTMPSYAHFVSIKHNFLAPNVTTMQSWPYFSDDFNYNTTDGLKHHYTMDVEGREAKLLHLLQGQKLDEYVESALKDLGIRWADVLNFLLDPQPDVGPDADAQKALSARKESCDEEFTRRGERTALVLSAVPSTPEKLGRAATLCENFLTMTKFSLWHVVRRHLLDYEPKKEDAHSTKEQLLNELTCRICLRIDCPYHGEIREVEEEEYDEDEEVDKAFVTDIVHPPNVNARDRIEFPADREAVSGVNETASAGKSRSLAYWHGDKLVHKPEDRGPFYPCHHPEQSCEAAHCSCFEEKLPCEKTCTCPGSCMRKFPGCSCNHQDKKKGQKIMCFEDDRCLCFSLSRECDPDLCGTCGVCDVLDPVNRYDEGATKHRCHNASLQRGVPKRTLLGDSQVHGLGLYSGEDIRPHEFVGEYKGELITKEEADRRGAVYEHQHLSYLFALNTKQEIDSTYFGNKIRFINHASHGAFNLYPKVFLVNTVHRIALFAERYIKKGTELLFDYGPKFPQDQLGGKTSKKSAGRTGRGNKVIDELWDVDFERDKFGNTRAIKATGQGQKGRPRKAPAAATKAKPRGGARPGAGRPSRKSAPELEEEGVEDLSDEPPIESQDDGEEEEAVPDMHQSAGARLAAFNISDDGPEDLMDVDAGADEDFDPEEASGESEEGEDDEDEATSDDGLAARMRKVRAGKRSRRL